ncbi:hypothetical protein T05_14619 [Trichinella murrelli]|uniref:Uncharacterized protein n=1 Tax=Trichinella murrelli TaxID=144512 RepID=A0A0V0T4P4_9BILA|nr:hypothetical protein T05_14619 [Trichinella murrelli]
MIKAAAHDAYRRKRLVNCLFDIGAERVGGSKISCQASRSVQFWLSSVIRERAEERYELEEMTATMLCEDPWQTRVSTSDWPHFQNLKLMKEVRELTPVHVINGLDSYFRFLGSRKDSTLVDDLRPGDIVVQGTKMLGPPHQRGTCLTTRCTSRAPKESGSVE